MRMLTYGAEISLADHGWVTDSGTPIEDTFNRHLTPDANGGARSLSMGASPGSELRSPEFEGDVKECWLRFAARAHTSMSDGEWSVRLLSAGLVDLLEVRLNATGEIDVVVDGSVEDTSASALSMGVWYKITVHAFLDSADGFIRVYLDEDRTTPIASFEGDTDPGAEGFIRRVGLSGFQTNFDDLVVNVPSVAFSSAAGTPPSAGDTVEGATSGATGIVVDYLAAAVGGRVLLHSITGTFLDGEDIESGAWGGACDGGTEPHSGMPKLHGYIVLLTPNGAGSLTMCTPTSGSNYQTVDDWFMSSTANDLDYVEGATDEDTDLYDVTAPTGTWTGVEVVCPLVRAKRQGSTINEIAPGLYANDFGQHYADAQALDTSFALHTETLHWKPGTTDAWVVGDLTDLQVGFKLTA